MNKPKYQYIEYPIKEMVRFSEMGDGRWRLHFALPTSLRKKLYFDDITQRTANKIWGNLDYQINKFVKEDGRFAITYQSYFPEYALPMVVFPKNKGGIKPQKVF